MWPFRKILFPTDFSDTSLAALPAAVEFASASGGELVLVHVLTIETATPWDDPPYADFGLAAMPVADEAWRALRDVRRRRIEIVPIHRTEFEADRREFGTLAQIATSSGRLVYGR